MKRKRFFVFATGLAISVMVVKGQELTKYTDNKYSAEFEQVAGKLSGSYISYYNNGIKKVEGNFQNNCRTGKWTIWDSTGVKMMERNYTSPLEYDITYTAALEKNNSSVNHKTTYQVKRDGSGLINLFDVNEEMIMYAKRIWRELGKDDNPILFNNNLLFTAISKAVNSGNVKVYDPKNDELESTFEWNTSKVRKTEVVAYKIKEDWFFDKHRQLMESRILAICPVVKSNAETKDLCWIYYPELRNFLSQKMEYANLPSQIQVIDDVFFYRYFNGKIYKESNVYDRVIKDYAKNDAEVEKENQRITISLLENEHDLWLW